MGSYGVSPFKWDHTVLPATRRAPCLNPSQRNWYSIYLPQRDGRLSLPWLYSEVVYLSAESPVQVVTTRWRPDRESSSRPVDCVSGILTLCHKATSAVVVLAGRCTGCAEDGTGEAWRRWRTPAHTITAGETLQRTHRARPRWCREPLRLHWWWWWWWGSWWWCRWWGRHQPRWDLRWFWSHRFRCYLV